jgi:hypothetical protein
MLPADLSGGRYLGFGRGFIFGLAGAFFLRVGVDSPTESAISSACELRAGLPSARGTSE